jgi:hypothetical protein
MNRLRFALMALLSPERLTLEIVKGFLEVVDLMPEEELQAFLKQVK